MWDDSGRGNGCRNKLRTYRKFKHDFYFEPYLYQIKDSAMRRSLCCFRISCKVGSTAGLLGLESVCDIYPLYLQGMAWCLKMGKEAVEDETHFLIEYNSYADERRSLFHTAAAHLPSFPSLGAEQQLVMLASSMDPNLLMCVAVYVHKCLLKRNVLLSCF